MLWRGSLRVSQAEQVAMRPTVALQILHRLQSEVVNLAADIPATHRVAQRPARIADFNDPVHGAHAVRLDAADQSVVVLLHEILPFYFGPISLCDRRLCRDARDNCHVLGC